VRARVCVCVWSLVTILLGKEFEKIPVTAQSKASPTDYGVSS